MVAFTFFGISIHRYGIFYVVGFGLVRLRLAWVGTQKFVAWNSKIQKIITTKKQDLFVFLILGVLGGGRLGHVLFYDPNYYFAHPLQIFNLAQGGMSFVGGVVGVVLALRWFARKQQLKLRDFVLLGDLLLVVLPLGILFGRLGNFLNQELVGKKIVDLGRSISTYRQSFWQQIGIFYVYQNVDQDLRINSNFLEGFFEGIFLFIVLVFVFQSLYGKKREVQPGLLTGIFFMLYAVLRFTLEFLRDNPPTEFIWGINKTQIFMVLFFIVGMFFILRRNDPKP